jgi:ribonuclease P protein component
MTRSFSYPKKARLLQRREFMTLSQRGETFYGKHVVIQWKKTALGRPRLGIIITKKFGKAHLRNRFKRLVREAFRLFHPKPSLGIDFTVRPRKNFELLTLTALCSDLTKFLTTFNHEVCRTESSAT